MVLNTPLTLLILINLIKILISTNQFNIWPIVEEVYDETNFNCYTQITNENISNSSNAYNLASTSSDPFNFSQNERINWDDFYLKIEKLIKILNKYTIYDDQINLLINSIDNLKKELRITIENRINLSHFIILINKFLKENQEKLDYLSTRENINLKTFRLRQNVQNLFKKIKAEILTDGISKHFNQLKICFKMNNSTFEELIDELISRKLNNELDEEEEEEIETIYKYLKKYYLINKAALLTYRLLSKEIFHPKYINDIELYRGIFYKPKSNFCLTTIFCGNKKPSIPFEEEANIYLKIYWITEYFIKENLISLDSGMKEIIEFIEKNQFLPNNWVNAVIYLAKPNLYRLPKILQWSKNINLTIIKLLVGYTRFEKFYKLNSVYGELIRKNKKLELIENIEKEINEWNSLLPEDFNELIYREDYGN